MTQVERDTSGRTKRVYCTYFDHNYLTRGLATIRSLRERGETGRVWVLCLTDACYSIMQELAEPDVWLISIDEFEATQAPIAELRAQRSELEYYYTLTPALVCEVLGREPAVEWVTYIDGDLWFFSDPDPIYQELSDASIGIIEHKYPPGRDQSSKFGTYNVAWNSFRQDENGRACAKWWDERCRERCTSQLGPWPFADQGYLDSFAELFEGVRVISHPGADLAPWNIAGHQVSVHDAEVLVNDLPLIFYHYSGISRHGARFYFKHHVPYDFRLDSLTRERIYAPYLRTLGEIERELAPRIRAHEPEQSAADEPLPARARGTVRRLRSRLRGDSMKVRQRG